MKPDCWCGHPIDYHFANKDACLGGRCDCGQYAIKQPTAKPKHAAHCRCHDCVNWRPTTHVHSWLEKRRDENDNRVRTHDVCACGATRSGCYAFRYDANGDPAWGTPGKWHYDVSEAS